MLKWFRRDENQHPLTSKRGLQEAIAELRISAPQDTLQDIADWFLSFAKTEDLDPKRRLEVVLTLDEIAYDCEDALWFQLRAVGDRTPAFATIRKALIDYTTTFLKEVEIVLDKLDEVKNAKDAAELKQSDDAIILVGRGIRAFALQKKARHVRHELVTADAWLGFYKLFQFARQQAATGRKTKLYKSLKEETLITREFMRALMIDTLPVASMDRRQVEVMDAILDQFSNQFLLRGQVSELTPFFVDLAQGYGPRRVGRVEPPESAVFIGPGGTAISGILQLLKRVAGGSAIPEYMIVPESTEQEDRKLAASFEPLIRHWSRVPPQRKNSRAASRGLLDVVSGFRQVRAMIAFADLQQRKKTEGMTATLPPGTTNLGAMPASMSSTIPPNATAARAVNSHMMETWEITDRSDTGLGTALRKRPSWLALGALVGHRPQGELEETWEAATIKRIHHDPKGKLLAGLGSIEGTLKVARFGSATHGKDDPWSATDTSGVLWFDAIAIPSTNRLLLEHYNFPIGMIAIVRVGNEKLHVKLLQQEMSGGDYEYWKYEPVTEQEWRAILEAADKQAY